MSAYFSNSFIWAQETKQIVLFPELVGIGQERCKIWLVTI
jgi:hypothetical protein